ncbi:MAG: hypothetical protein E7466_03790 [Ruminococcaceae bacterium]|nr:hypothetical protein [Oscillospiraceae bacterium]MBQ3215074.1 hypothetical protein [Oscillospiraceae bacterium]
MKRFLTLTLALLMVAVLLTGCGGTKEYTCQNLTMTVPDFLEDASDEPEFSKFTFTLDSSKIAVFGTREELKANAADLDAYTKLVIIANDYAEDAFKNEGNYMLHEYTKAVDGEDYNYMIGLYDGGDAYWMIQVGGPTDKFDRDQAIDILNSVKFS